MAPGVKHGGLRVAGSSSATTWSSTRRLAVHSPTITSSMTECIDHAENAADDPIGRERQRPSIPFSCLAKLCLGASVNA
jgi:hypothetical protein